MSAVNDTAAARAYWSTFAGKNPLNASSLVYGLCNDLDDERARAEAAEAKLAAVLELCDRVQRIVPPGYLREPVVTIRSVRAAALGTEAGDA